MKKQKTDALSSSSADRPSISLSFYSRSPKSSVKTLTLPAHSPQSCITTDEPTPQGPELIDSIQEILNFRDDNSQCSQRQGLVESGSGVSNSQPRRRSEWETWAELVSDEDSLATCWTDLLGVEGANEHGFPMCYQSKVPSNLSLGPQSGEHWQTPGPANSSLCGAATPASEGQSSCKSRLRWTPELHERFVEAVNQFGGAEKATPKGVLKVMNVEGLTIFHVKSHLQKYRIAKYIPDSPECKADKKRILSEGPSLDSNMGTQITEALRLQMDMQKRLHDQLEAQRILQLQIEEQGKQLQKMIEDQKRTGKLVAMPGIGSRPALGEPGNCTSNPTVVSATIPSGLPTTQATTSQSVGHTDSNYVSCEDLMDADDSLAGTKVEVGV